MTEQVLIVCTVIAAIFSSIFIFMFIKVYETNKGLLVELANERKKAAKAIVTLEKLSPSFHVNSVTNRCITFALEKNLEVARYIFDYHPEIFKETKRGVSLIENLESIEEYLFLVFHSAISDNKDSISLIRNSDFSAMYAKCSTSPTLFEEIREELQLKEKGKGLKGFYNCDDDGLYKFNPSFNGW